MSMAHTILVADYHRNGIGGAGFYVAIVETTEPGEPVQRYLCVDFSGDPSDPDNYDPGRFAVLRVDQVAAGNVGMHPITHPESGQVIEGTGGAAYRGADSWGNALRGEIRAWVRRSADLVIARMRAQREQGR